MIGGPPEPGWRTATCAAFSTAPAQAVRDDVETLLNSELIPDDITISGAIYDVQTGELREVVRG